METEFSRKLNEREITPSAAAWDRLDAMLTASEAQPKIKSKTSLKWLFVAAGILGFLFVGSVIFRQDKTEIMGTENEIVEAAQPEANSGNEVQVPKQEIAVASETDPVASKMIRKTHRFSSDTGHNRQLADNATGAESEDLASDANHQIESVSIIGQKTNQSDPVRVTQNASVDELLAAARSRRETHNSNVKVNARKLLLEVDSQAEEKLSPRQRALRALNRNYQQVKVAVENRNFEETH